MPKRRWLEKLIDEYIGSIAGLSDHDEGYAAAEHCARWMKDKWVQRGLSSLSQQRNLMTAVRNAIKQRLGPDHFALKSMNFSPEQWTEMNNSIEDRVAAQNTDQVILTPRTVNSLVYRATHLLISNDWADIACGLAVLTGRRHTEVMKTAKFEGKSNFSVMFSGALKRRGEAKDALVIEIPTLCRADYVLSGIAKLRAMVLTDTMTNDQVNARYSEGVSTACDRNFSDLVPPPSGRDRLYTHLFRKVYAAIAHYFYCPRWVSDWEFKAHVQGHYAFVDADSPVMRRKIAADRHYDAYAIEDEQGNRRKGIKLGQHGVEVVEIFQRPEAQDVASVREDAVRSSPNVLELSRHIAVPQSGAPPTVAVQSKFASAPPVTVEPASVSTPPATVKPKSTSTKKEPTMTEENLSQFELITYSEAYQLALDRGFVGSKKDFRTASTKKSDTVTKKFGVQRDRSIQNPAINQPTWRDLRSKKKVAAKASRPASSSSSTPASRTSSKAVDEIRDAISDNELEVVRKLSTGIDFLAQEISSVRIERDAMKAEHDLLRTERDTALAELDLLQEERDHWQQSANEDDGGLAQEIAAKDAQIATQQQQLDLLRAQVADLKETYQELEPILKVMGRAQVKFQEVVPDVPEVQPKPTTSKKTDKKAETKKASTATKKTGSQKKSESQPSTSKSTDSGKGTRKGSKTKVEKIAGGDRSLNGKTSQTKEKPKQTKSQVDTSGLDPAVSHALDAIMAYNDEPKRAFEEKWAISYPVMKELLTQVGSSTQTKIKAVFDARGQEIDKHMQKHGLGKRHNRNHQGERISDVLILSPKA